MTLDPEKIEQWAEEADTHAHSELGTFASGSAWRRVRDAHFARLARAEAFEAAAKTAEAYEPRCDACPSGVSTAIRALAEREKET